MMNYTQIKNIEYTEGRRCEMCNLTFSTNDSLKILLRIARVMLFHIHIHVEELHCEKSNITLSTNNIQFNHALGPKCHKQTKKGSSGKNHDPVCCIGQ